MLRYGLPNKLGKHLMVMKQTLASYRLDYVKGI